MHITIIYNEPLPSKYNTLGEDIAISSVMDSVTNVQKSLTLKGYTVTLLGLVPPVAKAIEQIKTTKTDLFFNLFEGVDGDSDTEWQFVEALESLSVPFTGAKAQTIKLCLDKALTKDFLADFLIPTAPYQVLEDSELITIDFPCILKPSREDASHGLSEASVVYKKEDVEQQLKLLQGKYKSPIMAEKFLSGREFNVSILGETSPTMLPPSEIMYSNEMRGPKILTYAAKWLPEDPSYKASMPQCPASLSDGMLQKLTEIVFCAHKAVGSPSYARVDLRCDENENLYVLEVNPNPDLSPEAGLALQARTSGLSYSNLVEKIVLLAGRK